ncbi:MULTISPECIES: tryptophan synthase subunit alpha [Chitinophaga]|uniref:tryptophan synthase subunit alpha n=1 Tax=Chitinophaga TaxID=79328 RepID=UPI000DBA4116|nr:tryptophan synthase subunit alpha [Chitinophaga ginsengisegetis]MDR6566971.1 tryptophan synthase alpha chain [Chitinophaga ginsengisegetis]MDR6646701.1 tryptophan synthase alpha chain [Chitinophaga ginsengisegetis]MDR6653051.1 tryptophan synthase alpha chain [Chitinophaga ginsengisegetis]
MQNRIDQLFAVKRHNVLNIYCTAGFPELNDTLPVMTALQQYGADLIELGMPFSDPLADGPVIQDSSTKALQNGMSLHKLFEQLTSFRDRIQVPVILMGYFNPVLTYGVEAFCAKCAEVGVDGIIVPDLPMAEYENEYRPIFEKYNLHLIFLVTPETSEERIRKIDSLSKGFIYAVSSSSTTGKDKDMKDQQAYFERLKQLQLKNPVLIGFGIKDKATFEAASAYANGAIIGTAFIRAIEHSKNIDETVKTFISGITQ